MDYLGLRVQGLGFPRTPSPKILLESLLRQLSRIVPVARAPHLNHRQRGGSRNGSSTGRQGSLCSVDGYMSACMHSCSMHVWMYGCMDACMYAVCKYAGMQVRVHAYGPCRPLRRFDTVHIKKALKEQTQILIITKPKP